MARSTRKPGFALHAASRPLGWAVIGLGMGMCHADLITHTPGLKLVALCDIDPAALARGGAKFPKATLYPSVDALLQDDHVDGVSVVIPHDQHAAVALRTIAADRHTVVDKPFALTVAQGRQMTAAAQGRRRLLSVFHNRRWDGDFVTIRRAIARGAIGRPRYIESRIASAWQMRPGRWRSNRAQMGGLLYDWPAHCIDQCLQLMPSPAVSVYGFTQRDLPCQPGWDVEDRAQAQINFADGGVALVAWNLNSAAPQPRWLIEGDKGGLRSDKEISSNLGSIYDGGVSLYRAGRNRQIQTSLLPFAAVDWTGFYRNVNAALRGKADLVVTPQQALRHVAICAAAYQSVRTGQVELLPADVMA